MDAPQPAGGLRESEQAGCSMRYSGAVHAFATVATLTLMPHQSAPPQLSPTSPITVTRPPRVLQPTNRRAGIQATVVGSIRTATAVFTTVASAVRIAVALTKTRPPATNMVRTANLAAIQNPERDASRSGPAQEGRPICSRE